jgi:putative ubiquitin-RnfH superfamily antitoxin RatB of RatAB toxin-antitoxin module
MAERILIEVAHARADGIYLRTLRLPPGSTVADALGACDLVRRYPDIDLDTAPVGIHGRKVKRDQVLREGDRVEVYRPLRIDPMQARRLRAQRSTDR